MRSLSPRWAGWVALYALTALATIAAVMWRVTSGAPTPMSHNAASAAVKAWKGGELLACMVTVNGAGLAEFAHRYNVVMLCGTRRPDVDRFTDRAITVSKAFTIEPNDFQIEEAVSGPMRVHLDQMARTRRRRESSPPARVHDADLWYDVVLLPKGIDAFAVRTLSDVKRFGGRLLLTEPRWSTISTRVP